MSRSTYKQPDFNKGEKVLVLWEGKEIEAEILEYIPQKNEYFIKECTAFDRMIVEASSIVRKPEELGEIKVTFDFPSNTMYYDTTILVNGKMYYIRVSDITNKSI
jgi:hypothetical protein